MRAVLTSITVAFLLLVVPAAPASAQQESAADAGVAVTDPLEWDEGPAGFLLTKDEKKDWKKITSR